MDSVGERAGAGWIFPERRGRRDDGHAQRIRQIWSQRHFYAFSPGTGNPIIMPPSERDICVECYMRWKGAFTGKLFGEELNDAIPAWGETTELMLSSQSQVPFPVLVPDLTSSAKRSMLYSSLFAANGDGGGMVKCGGRDAHEAKCHDMYETDLDARRLMAKPRGERNYALCKENAFDRYQQCRGY